MRFLQYTLCCAILTPATSLCFLFFIKTTALQAGSLTLQETYRQQIFTRSWIVFYYKPYKALLPCRKNIRQTWYGSLANILWEDTELLKQNLQLRSPGCRTVQRASFLFSLFLRLILFAPYFYCVISKLLIVSSVLLCF